MTNLTVGNDWLSNLKKEETILYSFEELSKKAQQVAIEVYRMINLPESEEERDLLPFEKYSELISDSKVADTLIEWKYLFPKDGW